MSTVSMGKVQSSCTVDNVHGLTGQSPDFHGHDWSDRFKNGFTLLKTDVQLRLLMNSYKVIRILLEGFQINPI